MIVSSEEAKLDEKVETQKEDTIKKEEVKKDEAPKKEKNKYKEQIASLEAELAKSKDEYLRALAEIQNTRKRLQEEHARDRKYASQKVVGELINPVDMLVKIVNAPAPSKEIENYLIGFQMIANQLVGVLEAEGLKEIKALDEEFDPASMQAMAVIETSDVKPNMVVEVMQAGYMYKDRVLRPAMVKVSKAVEAKNENECENKGEDNNE